MTDRSIALLGERDHAPGFWPRQQALPDGRCAYYLTPMSLEHVRTFCRSLPDAGEDVKWGNDLVFTIGGKMFCVINLEPPHQVAFKCTPETFAELVEQPGLIPAPYMARAMWVQERELGTALGRRDREELVRISYELVKAKLPKSRRSAARGPATTRKRKLRPAKRRRRTR